MNYELGMDFCCFLKYFAHLKKIFDKFHNPYLIVLAPPTYVLDVWIELYNYFDLVSKLIYCLYDYAFIFKL
jgi:hypothetical protein